MTLPRRIDVEPDLPPIGRERELSAVAMLIDGVRSGLGGALVVRGDPGIGKTTLLADTQRLAAANSMNILSCSGVPAESNLPFAGLHQLLRPVLGALASVSPHQARHLRVALGSEDGLPTDLYGVALATLELVAAAATDAPLLIVADDAHWIDRPSADVLAFVARRVGAEPIAIVVAVREGMDDPFAERDLPQLVLSPLDDATSAALLDRVAPDLAARLRDRILHSASGNPLALVELPSTAHRWGPSPEPIPVGQILERSFAARTEALPASTRLLLLAAAAGSGCTLAELCSAATEVHGAPVTPADVQPAIDVQLVRIASQQIAFRHPLLASAIYQRANIGERLATHLALSNASADADRRVWHRAAAAPGHDDSVAAELELLSGRAARRGAVSVSIAALDRAAALRTDRTLRADALLRASEQAVELGRRAVAMDLVARAQPDQFSPLGEARMLIVENELSPWRADDALNVSGLIDAAAAARVAGDPDLAVTVLWTAAKRCYWTSAPMEDRLAVDAAVTELELRDDDPRRLAILTYTGLAHHRGALERDLRKAGAQAEDVASVSYLASAAMNLGDDASAAALMASASSHARRQGRLGVIPRLQAQLAWATTLFGSVDAVAAAAGEAERLAVELDQPMWHGGAILEHALVTGLRGDYEAAKEQMRSGQRNDEIRGVRLFHSMAHYGMGVIALGAGQYQDAYENLRRVVDPSDEVSHYAARQWVAGDLVEAAIGAGRLTECADLIVELDADWRIDPPSTVQFWVSYADALIASDDAADECFGRALNVWPDGNDIALGRLHLAYGSWLRRHRRSREARGELATARKLFDQLGLGGFADRAGRELRAAGGVNVHRPRGVPGLTPQELQIAQLAVSGLSNRQIAEQLFLSHRTVGSHLYHIFPKLGISTRSELTTVLGSAML